MIAFIAPSPSHQKNSDAGTQAMACWEMANALTCVVIYPAVRAMQSGGTGTVVPFQEQYSREGVRDCRAGQTATRAGYDFTEGRWFTRSSVPA